MALPRPTCKGYLRLALVSCPIAVYSSASSTEKVRFNKVNRKTGRRIRQKMVDEGSGETAEAADKIRGYEVDKIGKASELILHLCSTFVPIHAISPPADAPGVRQGICPPRQERSSISADIPRVAQARSSSRPS